MTINEFKAWLEGLSEGIIGAPTPDQWRKIKIKIDSLSVLKVPEKVTKDLNPPPYRDWPKLYSVGIMSKDDGLL